MFSSSGKESYGNSGHGGHGGHGIHGGHKQKGHNKKEHRKDKLGCFLGLIAAKALGIKALLISGLFLLAKKALIISKVALLIIGIIALKKLVASKKHGYGVEPIFTGDGGDFVQPPHNGIPPVIPGINSRSGVVSKLAYNHFSPKY